MPWFIHVVNVLGLLAFGVIFIPAAAIHYYQLAVLVPIFIILAIVYWCFWSNRNVFRCFFSLSVFALLWIVICENIVTIDNILDTRIAGRLTLGAKLQSYVWSHFKSGQHTIEACCRDSLSYHLKPGSKYRRTYDCPTCNEPYEITSDETGYLNLQRGLLEQNKEIELFLAGDSVTQGFGLPGLLEFMKQRIPVRMWNLSLAGYGPRQKIHALLAYALPKNPRWLIVEFYSGNDLSDAIQADVCEDTHDFLCYFAGAEIYRRTVTHPTYAVMLHQEAGRIHLFDRIAENYFTVAVTRYLSNIARHAIRNTTARGVGITQTDESARSKSNGTTVRDPNKLSRPAMYHFEIRRGMLMSWAQAGMQITHQNYELLVTRLAELESKPVVVLLYNPSAYEIYRDILIDRNAEYDEVAAFQVKTQRVFAEKNGWIFLDLTLPLRTEIINTKTWIYGEFDRTHWSHTGTAFVANVLATELSKLTPLARTGVGLLSTGGS